MPEAMQFAWLITAGFTSTPTLTIPSIGASSIPATPRASSFFITVPEPGYRRGLSSSDRRSRWHRSNTGLQERNTVNATGCSRGRHGSSYQTPARR